MAVIDYKCKDCGESFFKIVNSQAERDSVVCPKCGGKEIKQVFGGTAYITAGKKGGASCGGHCGSCGSQCH